MQEVVRYRGICDVISSIQYLQSTYNFLYINVRVCVS